MADFAYKVIDSAGRERQGRISAPSDAQARAALIRKATVAPVDITSLAVGEAAAAPAPVAPAPATKKPSSLLAAARNLAAPPPAPSG